MPNSDMFPSFPVTVVRVPRRPRTKAKFNTLALCKLRSQALFVRHRHMITFVLSRKVSPSTESIALADSDHLFVSMFPDVTLNLGTIHASSKVPTPELLGKSDGSLQNILAHKPSMMQSNTTSLRFRACMPHGTPARPSSAGRS
jgi:hypothetical protein